MDSHWEVHIDDDLGGGDAMTTEVTLLVRIPRGSSLC